MNQDWNTSSYGRVGGGKGSGMALHVNGVATLIKQQMKACSSAWFDVI